MLALAALLPLTKAVPPDVLMMVGANAEPLTMPPVMVRVARLPTANV